MKYPYILFDNINKSIVSNTPKFTTFSEIYHFVGDLLLENPNKEYAILITDELCELKSNAEINYPEFYYIAPAEDTAVSLYHVCYYAKMIYGCMDFVPSSRFYNCFTIKAN